MPTLETYRKQAKLLQRWHREKNFSVGERLRRLERFRSMTDCDVLEMKFTLALAQEIVAVETGYKNWAELKSVSAGAAKTPRSRAGAPVLRSVVPILFVSDVKKSAGWFRDKLNFRIDFLHGLPPFYGAVSRDGICLHLRFVHRPFFAKAAAEEGGLILASIEVTNVRALFEEFKARDVAFAQRLKKQAWGGTDFHVSDPDGNVFSFVTYDHAE